MDNKLELKYETWKNKLLDLGKRNQLISYKDTKRSSLFLTAPNYHVIWEKIVEKDVSIEFPMKEFDEKGNKIDYELKTNKSFTDMTYTLRNLRNKSNLIQSEQGVNTLYLSFGFLKWKESDSSRFELKSPLVLVPVQITIESIASPYVLSLGDDDIVVNPSLNFKLEQDFGIKLPEFSEEEGIDSFFDELSGIVENKKWQVEKDVSISIMSFLKINMYHDLLRNKDKILSNEIIQALGGIVKDNVSNADILDMTEIDEKIKAVDSFQVVDADSSQLEAILYAKQGKSFVLQGPPGTGKSQTITNIISESIADGKKVLFVSEKMAALDVVYRRLAASKLDDFCLVLHSSKANKKNVIEQLMNTLELSENKAVLSDEAYLELEQLEKDKKQLNDYAKQIFEPVLPLNKTIYEVNGSLSKLQHYKDIIFPIENIKEISSEKFNTIRFYLNNFSSTIGKMTGDYLNNPWFDSSVEYLTNELRHDISARLGNLIGFMDEIDHVFFNYEEAFNLKFSHDYISFSTISDIVSMLKDAKPIPECWLYDDNIDTYFSEIKDLNRVKEDFQQYKMKYAEKYSKAQKYNSELPSMDMDNLVDYKTIQKEGNRINEIIQTNWFLNNWIRNKNLEFSEALLEEINGICSNIRKIKNHLLESYEDSIFDLDYKSIEIRFKTEYTNYFKALKSSYREDKKKFLACKKVITKKITDAEMIEVLDALKKIAELRSWFTTNQKEIKLCFNNREYDENTELKFEYDKIAECHAIMETKKDLEELRNISKDIDARTEELEKHYSFLYEGLKTDWNNVDESLKWALLLKEISSKYSLDETFMKRICKDIEFCRKLNALEDDVQYNINKIKSDIEWYANLFSDTSLVYEVEFLKLKEKMQVSVDNLKLLEEWIDFKSSRNKCIENGLGEYIEIVQREKLSKNEIVPVFEKRFYRLWLDEILPEHPAVANFRRRTQEEVIKEFDRRDKLQFDIAKARIREKLINQLPSTARFTSGNDDIRILKREAGKQRKIMPIRKLFREIPDLVLTLKPCLMMSPLSVSLFLESDTYKFDTVIFDEASQVMTENAIGAISRGKQVIIAGDSKQLPPTNFFTASTSTNDYDTDSEEDYEEEYESVLDEANMLPEKTLLWHYRSRHESLIAFSNAKIYKNKLTTFPSNIAEGADIGVEYVYVRNGVYSNIRKKGNIEEAKKIAKMVFEHFSKHPDQSLGVIAFGEVQQQAIENVLTQMRKENQAFEIFFKEDKEEPFFVKNLENVQGDERDTIIFSIGYAKDAEGIFKMNFGPLSRVGGERRLNVAITRAKYNVKLVGSILPTDIDVDRITTEGPKLLRNYIDFAMNGQSVLDREITETDIVEHDSPFEESVYNYLDRKGYKLATQVGCSGYRIDMAVKHPTKSGIYVLGIECDGATYHSAKNARERDRLRQEVLENMGWRIYRIWSTDWIKDPVTEGKLLLEEVEHAIETYDAENYELTYSDSGYAPVLTEKNNEYISIEEKTDEDIYRDYGFVRYEETTYDNVSRDSDGYLNAEECAIELIHNEYPISFDTICFRMKSLWGREKITVFVREQVQYLINAIEDDIVCIDGYYYPRDYSTIPIRLPNDRKIENISNIEIQVALLKVLKNCIGADKKSIISETANFYGFKRKSTKILQAFEIAFEALINNHNIAVEEEKVTLLDDNLNL